MKKILVSLFCISTLLSSCDLETRPAGVLDDETAIISVADCESYRNGFYTNLRALTGGAYIAYPALQMDEFFGTIINGNRHGALSNGVILSSDSDFESIWAGCYSAIVSVNFFLEKVDAIYNLPTTTDAEKQELDRFIGEAKFARAYYYYYLVDHFCDSYTNINPTDAATGVPIREDFNPTPDTSTYPGRATLAETFAYMEKQVQEAYDAMVEWEKVDASDLKAQAIYLNTNVVKAFQCRLALLKGDYEATKRLATEIINSGLYTITPRAAYATMWSNDMGSELIFVPFSSSSESCPSTGSIFTSADVTQADYIPTPYVVEHLYASNDIRKSTFISARSLRHESVFYNSPVFVKFPGNTSIGTAVAMKNRPKPFRLSEVYLNLAEACYELDDKEGANNALYELRSKRISRMSPGDVDYSGETLRDEIRLERQRELIGEGFRMSDLRRWKLGFSRGDASYGAPYAEAADMVVKNGIISYQAGDHRFVWPIPSSEIQINPQMRGQQNPGY